MGFFKEKCKESYDNFQKNLQKPKKDCNSFSIMQAIDKLFYDIMNYQQNNIINYYFLVQIEC